MLNRNQFENLITRTLSEVHMCSPAATMLLLGTAAQESRFGTDLKQINGPALGIFQCEPTTFNYLRNKYCDILPELNNKFFGELEWDLKLAIIMCRLKYRSIPEPLPKYGDIRGMARYWKKYYNTDKGKGTEAEFMDNFLRYVK